MQTRSITLPNKQTLEVQLTPPFLDRVADQFGILSSEVSDDHIRMFIFGAFKSAIDKAENEGFYLNNS
jgi:hypothetical protein